MRAREDTLRKPCLACSPPRSCSAPSRSPSRPLRVARHHHARRDPHVDYEGTQRLHYEFGPIDIKPGQNTIEFAPNKLKPQVPGYITRFVPNLIRANGSVPGVDELHLHHGVWLMRGQPTFASARRRRSSSSRRASGTATTRRTLGS
jgi:hypothetical protein